MFCMSRSISISYNGAFSTEVEGLHGAIPVILNGLDFYLPPAHLGEVYVQSTAIRSIQV